MLLTFVCVWYKRARESLYGDLLVSVRMCVCVFVFLQSYSFSSDAHSVYRETNNIFFLRNEYALVAAAAACRIHWFLLLMCCRLFRKKSHSFLAASICECIFFHDSSAAAASVQFGCELFAVCTHAMYL